MFLSCGEALYDLFPSAGPAKDTVMLGVDVKRIEHPVSLRKSWEYI